MRHTFKSTMGIALLAIAALAQSCKKQDLVSEEKAPQVSAERVEALRTAIAASTGFTANQVQYNAAKGTFSIDKDGMISLEDAQLRFPATADPNQPGRGTESQQRVYPYIITRNNAANIQFYADASVPAEWLAALDQSIANWNATNSLIVMKRVTGTTTTTTTTTTNTNPRKKKNTTTTTPTTTTSTLVPTYNVLVTTNYDAATSTVATAYYPDYYGNAGKQVTINTHYNTLSASYKLFAMTHELGHIIGFTHTDGSYGEIIAGTPATDPNSVMNSFVLPWNGFTPYDVTAVTTVYPKY